MTLGINKATEIAFRNGFTFPYLGVEYQSMYISSNGYITFEKPSSSASHDLKTEFTHLKIAGFQGSLNPTAGGSIAINFIGSDRLVCDAPFNIILCLNL